MKKNKGISTDNNFIKAMNYYKKTYSISYEYIEKENVEFYNLLNKRTGFHISPQDENVFMIFKDGDAVSSYTGPYLESSIRKLLIDNNVLDEKYKEIDYVIYDNEFDEYFKKDTLFNILYINESSDDLYKYREILMKNNVKSLVLYANNIDSSDTCILFDEMFNINSDSYNNFPVLIKVKSGKYLSIEKNITLNNFMDKLSK